MSNTYQSTTRCVLCLSGTAALMVLVEAVAQVVVYSRVPNTGLRISGIVVAAIAALIVPCCGWQGARDRNPGLLGCFSCFNYFYGCLDFLAIGLGVFLAIFGMGLTAAAGACAPAQAEVSCDAEHKQQLLDACRQLAIAFNESIVNHTFTTKHNVTEEIHEMLSEENCIDSAQNFGLGLVAVGIVVAVLRCFDTCFHCASGWYGGKLQKLLSDGADFHAADSDSD